MPELERPADEDEITEPEEYVEVEPDGKTSDSRAHEYADDPDDDNEPPHD